MNLKSVVEKIGISIFVIACLLYVFKGSALMTWISPRTPETYSIEGSDGRSMSMIFLPENYTMIWYYDKVSKYTEGTLARMRGTFGNHYFWRLWQLNGPNIAFGYRIYPPDTKPVYMEITVLENFIEGNQNPSFKPKGDQGYQVILFGKDMVKFQDMWLLKKQNDPVMIQSLFAKLAGSQVK